MKINKINILMLFSIILFANCATQFKKINNVINSTNGTNFESIINNVSVGICPKLIPFNISDEIYITDFVNIADLKNNSQLGFVLSNELKVAINSKCNSNLNIKELTLGKNIQIGSQGTKILSRELSELKTTNIIQNGKVITGTYAITSSKLIIFIKVIDLENGNILYTKSNSTNITDEILELAGKKTIIQIQQPLVL